MRLVSPLFILSLPTHVNKVNWDIFEPFVQEYTKSKFPSAPLNFSLPAGGSRFSAPPFSSSILFPHFSPQSIVQHPLQFTPQLPVQFPLPPPQSLPSPPSLSPPPSQLSPSSLPPQSLLFSELSSSSSAPSSLQSSPLLQSSLSPSFLSQSPVSLSSQVNSFPKIQRLTNIQPISIHSAAPTSQFVFLLTFANRQLLTNSTSLPEIPSICLPPKKRRRTLSDLVHQALDQPYYKRYYAITETRKCMKDIEDTLSVQSRTLKEVLFAAATVDQKSSGKVVVDTFNEVLEYALEKEDGITQLYKEIPQLQAVFKKANEQPHWKVIKQK